jgi:beta-glucosidase
MMGGIGYCPVKTMSAVRLLLLAVIGSGCFAGTFSSFDSQIVRLLTDMTLDEKIGQMIQAENTGLQELSDIENYYLGSILSGGSADPKEGNNPEHWVDLYESLQQRTTKTRLKIPLLYGIDAVHGHNNVLGAVIFPHNIGLGCTGSAELVEEIARITAREVRATGIQWAFAPCITVPQDERWGRTYEGFSENAELAAVLGAAAVRGLQGQDLSGPFSVLACAKHYVGDGGTAFGSSANGKGLDQGDTRVDEKTLRRVHLRPYPAAIKVGVGSIMPSYSSWNGVKCSANRYLLTTVLKEKLGFEGFLISDYNAIKQIDPDFKKAVGISVNAGMDMAMEPTNYRDFFHVLKELVNEGTVPMSRINDAVRRILRVKFAMGLMHPDYNCKVDRSRLEEIGSEAHRAVARQAVRESLVLLKNEARTLPIPKTAGHIVVAGKAADDIGIQCGGWTIDWQGKSGEITPGGTTLLKAIRSTVSNTTKVTFSKDGMGVINADVAVVVIGEEPYAEGSGDRENLNLAEADVQLFRNVKGTGIPVVVVLISGRPMIINEVLREADAFAAVWLPGTEGQGIADILFGDYSPSGKLSFTWPRSMEQIPINAGDKAYNPLFEYGFGLKY